MVLHRHSRASGNDGNLAQGALMLAAAPQPCPYLYGFNNWLPGI